MIEHEEALELAASALDFGLSDDDRAALGAHLDGCPDCRAFDERMRGDARGLADLSTGDAPSRLRARVLGAIPGQRSANETAADAPSAPGPRALSMVPPGYRRPAAMLAAAAVVVMLIAGGLYWNSRPDGGPTVAEASPSASSPSGSVPPAMSGQPGSNDASVAWTPVADLTADDAKGGIVALGSRFRLASLDGTPVADLAARLTATPPITFKVEPAADGRSATITPSEPLTSGALYRFTLAAADGRTLDTWAFQAHKPLQVIATLPRDMASEVPTDTGIEVIFDQDGVIDAKSHVSISPKVTGRFEQHGRTLAFVPAKRLAKDTMYTVAVRRGVAVGGTQDSLEADVRFRFETAGGPKVRTIFQFSTDLVDAATTERPTIALWVSRKSADGERTINRAASARIVVDRLPDLEAAIAAYRQVRSFPHWARGASVPLVPTKGLPRVAAFDAKLKTSDDIGFSWFQLPNQLAPGWYVVSLPSPTQTVQTILQVSDVAGYLVISDTKTLVWANDLGSGDALAGASVAVDRVDLGRTEADGTLVADTPKSLSAAGVASCPGGCLPVITVRSGTHALLMSADGAYDAASSGGDPYQSYSGSRYWSTLDTDRTTFRRSDTVNLWGVTRDRKTGAVPGTVVVRLFGTAMDPVQFGLGGDNAAGAPLSTLELHPNAIGAFSGSIALGDLPEGSYVLESNVANEVVDSTSFQIDRILKPAYRLEVVTGRRVYFVGDQVKVTTTATFFEGSPVPGVALRVDGFVERSLNTDATGTATVRSTIKLDGETAYGQPDVRIVNVSPARAEEGQIAGASREIIVFPSTGVLEASAVIDAGGARVTGTLRSVDRDRLEREIAGGKSPWEVQPAGAPIAARTVKATLTELIPYQVKTGTRYDFIEKKVVPVYDTGVTQRPAGAVQVTTRADGSFVISIPVSNSGHTYEVRLSSIDSDGHAARWLGWASLPGIQQNDYEADPSLLPTSGPAQERQYGVGDAIDLTMHDAGIDTGTSGRYLFYTAQQGLRDVTVQTSSRYRTTFGDWAPPSVWISGVRFTGSGYVESQEYLASFRRADRQLTIDLTTDQPRYGPGAEVKLTVTTRDPSGKPVPATVVLRGVDEKLFAIGAATAADPLGRLYSEVGSGIVMTYRSHREPIGRFEGGDTTGGGGEGSDTRANFRDVVLFKQVDTGSDGTATVIFNVADDLTAWRVSASAFGDGLLAGEGSIGIPVGLPFFVDATIAPEYLVTDRPILGFRAFGTALDVGAPVSFAVDSDALGLHLKGLAAEAFETRSVPLPKLAVGSHTITITATTGTGGTARRDALTRTFTVATSRLTRTRTAYVEPRAAVQPPGGDGRVEVIVSDAGAAHYVPLLVGLTGVDSARMERTLAASVAASLLKDRFDIVDGVPANGFDRTTYQGEDGGIAILPYAGSTVQASALVALVAPDAFDRTSLVGYLRGIVDSPGSTREARNLALAGLAGLQEPVLPAIRTAAADPQLTAREGLMLGLGAAAMGDSATARATGASLVAQYGEVTGELARLRVGVSAADVTEGTALMAMLAAANGDPLAGRLWSSVEADPGTEAPYGLQAVGFVSRLLERDAPRTATFAYTVAGTRQSVELKAGEAFHISLSHEQFGSFTIESVSGQIGVTTSWQEAVKPSAFAEDPDLTISRQITPGGTIGTAALVVVDLTVHLGPKAPLGCHLVTDLVPSGLVPVGNLEGWVDPNNENAPRNATYPFAETGQRVSFCAERGSERGGTQSVAHLRYFARVVTAGTYAWEPAVAESRSEAGRAAITEASVVTIR
ncbi:MAG: Ig-like domain-containing protein [Chloroflexota bacterium]